MTRWLDPEEAEPRALFRFATLDGKRALEIGCGRGRLLYRCARRTAHIIGIEPNPDYVSAASEECPPNLATRVALIRGSAMALPLSNGAFDVALFGWSL